MCDDTCIHENEPLKGSSSGQTASVWGFGGAHHHPPLTVLELTPIESIKKAHYRQPQTSEIE